MHGFHDWRNKQLEKERNTHALNSWTYGYYLEKKTSSVREEEKHKLQIYEPIESKASVEVTRGMLSHN